jgi:hypothetical protein
MSAYDEWKKKQFPSLIGSTPQQFGTDSIVQNLTATGLDDFAAYDAAQLAQQGIGEGAVAQNLSAAGVQDADFVAADATQLASQAADAAPTGEFDFKAISKALGGGEDTFKFDAPNMTLSRGTPPPVQALAPPQKQQQPLSTAMGAIESANQMYGMQQPMQMPQQQQQPEIIRRMLGLA